LKSSTENSAADATDFCSVVVGDAVNPHVSEGHDGVVIAHICNDIGKWGAGFVVPLGNKYPRAKSHYLESFKDHKLRLGEVFLVEVTELWASPVVFVCNMVSQRSVASYKNPDYVPFRMDAFRECVDKLYNAVLQSNLKLEVAGPMMGSGLAGGNWSEIESVLRGAANRYKVKTTIYKLDE
jgi:hypothetical protein